MPVVIRHIEDLTVDGPRLAIPGEFVLDTDTSYHDIGAALRQVELPTADVRRTLLKAESNYCVTQKDLLALVIG